MKIHVGDNVLVTTGKYKGKTGSVMRLSEKRDAVVVEKMNIRTKHVKKRAGEAQGQRIQYEAPMNASKVMVVCPHCKKPTRVGYTIITEGNRKRKQRVCKKCSQSLDKVTASKKTAKKS